MKSNNILDSEEKEYHFLYGNRALYCLTLSLLCLLAVSIMLSYIEGKSFSRELEALLILTPLGGMGIVTLVGCYFGIQGIRYKEPKQLRSILGLLGNFLLLLTILLGVLLAHAPQQTEPFNPTDVIEVAE